MAARTLSFVIPLAGFVPLAGWAKSCNFKMEFSGNWLKNLKYRRLTCHKSLSCPSISS